MYLLESYGRAVIKDGKIAGQCLAKEMVTILKALKKIVHVNYHTDYESGTRKIPWDRFCKNMANVDVKNRADGSDVLAVFGSGVVVTFTREFSSAVSAGSGRSNLLSMLIPCLTEWRRQRGHCLV